MDSQDDEPVYAHFDQPAFEQLQTEQNISRAAIFFVCFLTVGVFYFALVALPVSRLLPIQQLNQVGNLLNPGPARPSVAASGQPAGLGAAQDSASPAASAAENSALAGSPKASTGAVSSPSAPSPSGAALTSTKNSPQPSGGTYTVQAGDTLSAIARRYNTTAQALASANHISDASSLRVGEKLTIP